MAFRYLTNEPVNRLKGRLSKIGIRPVIDGRRNGVRESLEDQTMALAKSVAGIISSSLKHANGLPVECIIADTTIGGVTEAAQCAEKFALEGVGGVISVTPCWCYASETIDMDPVIPKAIWGFNGTERPGAVYLAGALSAYDQMGLPAYKIYGRNVQEKNDSTVPGDVKDELLRFSRAALALSAMRGKSYLSMGGVSMGIAASMVDHDFFRAYLGMRYEFADMTEFTRRITKNIFDENEFGQALDWVKENCDETLDPNPPDNQNTREQKNEQWETSIKMALIARDLMVGNHQLAEIGYVEEAEGHNALCAGFQGQRQWTDLFPTGDFMEAILNSSFDWTGIREPYIVATENDSLNAVGMMMGHLLTGRAQIFADVRTYWSPEAVERVTNEKLPDPLAWGFLYLSNSGSASLDGTGMMEEQGRPAMKPFWEITSEEATQCVEATKWGPAKLATFRGGGFSSAYRSRGGMPMTMFRLNIVKGLGPFLQIAQGESIDLPEKMYDIIVDRTDPTWPKTFFVPYITGYGAFSDIYSVMKCWGANHCVLSYGHIGADLITLASMLRIPVNMHNVGDEDIFRPSYWNAFGTESQEGADYRACAVLGPLYGKY